MKLFKNIFGRIWALWGLMLFVTTMVVALLFMLPCFFLKDPQRAGLQQKVSRVWMRVFLTLIGCPLKIKNKKVFEKNKNYIIVCNHNSLMDVPVTNPFMPKPTKTIAKKSFAKVPLFGWIYQWGSVLVDRNSEKSRKQSYFDMKAVLSMGMDMVLYPEGTRNKTNQPLKKFHNGAFKLAVDTQHEILPAILLNTKKILPADKFFYLMPHTIELHFLKPTSPSGFSAEELKNKIFEEMWNYYEANY